MGLARLIELAFSRRNIREGVESTEGTWSRRTFPGIVAVHIATILGTLFCGGKARQPWLALLLAVQPLRYWVLLSLGPRWNARGAVAADLEPVTSGPYAYVRHPNYAVVIAELWSLPAAFGVGRLAAIATVLNALLLTVRIRDEEALLLRIPTYQEHFAHKRRLLPFIF
jgi:methyltransferase